MKSLFITLGILVLILVFYPLVNSHKTITSNSSTHSSSSATIQSTKKTLMTITSTAFADYGAIPTKYTCDGQGINPPLTFTKVPAEAKSLVLLMDDPDVPKTIKPDGVFDHWVVYNIPTMLHEISENSVPQGVSQGLNGAGKEKYAGPCPPDREHRYFFKLYALDTTLQFDDPSKVTKQMVIDAMQRHIIEEATLVGVYNRPQNQK